MPQFINSPYSSNSDGGIAGALSGIGQSMFGDTARRALVTQEMLAKQRQNEFNPQAADALARGDIPGAISAGVRAGMSGTDVANYNLVGASGRAHGNVDDPNLATAQMGAHEPIASTAVGQGRELGNRLAQTRQQGANAIATEQSKPVTIMGPDGALHLVPSNQTEHLINAGGYRLIPTVDQGTSMSLYPQGQPGAAAPPAPQPAAAPAAPQPIQQDPSMPGAATVPGQPAVAAPPPIAPDTTAQHFSPASLPPQTKPVPQPQQPGQPDASAAPQGPQPVSYPGQMTPEAREAYLSRLNPAVASAARAVARGDAPYPSLAAASSRNPLGRAVYEAVHTAYPEINDYNHAARMVEARSWAGNGINAVRMGAANTVLPHLEAASNNFAKMDNGQYPALNWLDNAASQVLGTAPIQKFLTDRLAVGTELARLLHGSGALSEGEIKSWQDRLSSSSSPAAMNANLAELGDTLAGARIDAAQNQYRSIVTGHEPPIQLMPAAIKARETLRARAAPAAATQGPVKVSTPEEAHALAPGTHYLTPDGGEFTR